MRYACVQVGVVVLAVVAAAVATAGDACPVCRGIGGAPYRGGACGPRVFGPCHEPVGPIDQCDACARFAGCEGYRQMPEMLVPWQLPPGRGFQPPEAFGYPAGACAECAGGGHRGGWRVRW